MDICEICEVIETSCDCVYCKSCGRKTKRESMWQGKCDWCEDKQMVQGIR